MNIKRLKEILKPWIQQIVREELNKSSSPMQGFFGKIPNDKKMDQILKNASRVFNLFKGVPDGKDLEEVVDIAEDYLDRNIIEYGIHFL